MNKETLNNKKRSDLFGFLFDNKVVFLFIIVCAACIVIADASLPYVAGEVFSRFARNTCIVLALIVPCLAGLGMNFGITIGAIAAQISIFFIVHWGFTGITGMLLCFLMSTPLAILFGWLLGVLYNHTKGSEMIAGLVLGFFADGLYRLFVLYIIGGVIPYDDPNLLPRGFGLRNAFDLTGNLKYSIDDLSFVTVIRVFTVAMIVVALASIIFNKAKKREGENKKLVMKILVCAVGFGLTFVVAAVPSLNKMFGGTRMLFSDAVKVGMTALIVVNILKQFVLKKAMSMKKFIITTVLYGVVLGLSFVPAVYKIFKAIKISAATYGLICLFCFFNNWILNTKLGQDMRTVGQSRVVASSAGINVDRVRIIATCISTVLAAWGQLIYLQNLGTFNTVQQQSNVGLYSVAAILVGGANVQKANNKQAVMGVLLFHTLFVVAPLAATKIFNDSAISEYIRMFISYGVIAVSLAMHAWKKTPKKADKEETTEENTPKLAEAE